ncbi:Conserved hypothetical protein [gamma proteobacterium HdN1]|nr:Conserved hypothetical protein [gamma proteobacterium HdN1]
MERRGVYSPAFCFIIGAEKNCQDAVLKRIKKIAVITAIVLVVYALIGFVVLPQTARLLANHFAKDYLKVPAHLDSVSLNPFTGELALKELVIGDAAEPLARISRLMVNLQLDSAWTRSVHLSEVVLEGAEVRAEMAKDGKLNLVEMLNLPAKDPAEETPEADAKEEAGLFPIRIDETRLQLAAKWTDQRHTPATQLAVNDLQISAQQLSTRPDERGQWSIQLDAGKAGKLAASGKVLVASMQVDGKIDLLDSVLPTFWPYAPAHFPIALADGTLSVGTEFRVDASKGLQVNLDNAWLKLNALQVVETASADAAVQADAAAENSAARATLLAFNALEVDKVSLDLANQEIVVGSVRLDGVNAPIVRESDGRMQLERLLASISGAAAETKPTGATPTATMPADAAPEPAGAVSEPTGAAPEPSSTTPEPSSTAPEPTGAASEIVASNASAPTPPPSEDTKSKPWHIVVPDLKLQNTAISFTDQSVKPLQTLRIEALQLGVQSFDSTLKEAVTLDLAANIGDQGKLHLAGSVHLDPISAKLQLDTQHLDLSVLQPYLTPFVRIELRSGALETGLKAELASLEPLRFEVSGDVAVDNLHTLDTIKRRDLLKWQQLRISGIQYHHGESLMVDGVKLQDPYARFVINDDRTTNIRDLMVEPPAPKAAETKTEPPASTAKKSQPLPIHIRVGKVEISNGSANFADLSLTPSFSTAIGQLDGQVSTMDSATKTPALVDIKGKVDRYAPVSIKGSLTPFDPTERLDITAGFHRMELTTLTPYSGKFAGYRLRKGRLDLDVHYKIVQGMLTAENKVVLKDLQLGEKVESPDAMDLPIRLAIALLKDPKGNIKIELPIQGDINNPSFSVGPVLWKTLRNLIARAVTSPFSVIGGLAKGDGSENLDSIAFAAGSTDLDVAATEKLKVVATGLKDRSELVLEVEGASAASVDTLALGERVLADEIQKVYLQKLYDETKKTPANADNIQVPAKVRAELLTQLYEQRVAQPEPEEWRSLSKEQRLLAMEKAVSEKLGGSEKRLHSLARQRAAAIKEWLVETAGLSDKRIYLLNSQLKELKAGETLSSTLFLNVDEKATKAK